MADISTLNVGGKSYNVKDNTGRKITVGGKSAALGGSISGVGDAFIEWGGKHLAGTVSPIDAALVSELSADRFAYILPKAWIVEYSQDGGSTWLDYGATDAQMRQLCSTNTAHLRTGGPETMTQDIRHRLRLTLDTATASVYSLLTKFIIYLTSNGTQNCWVTVEAATNGNPTIYKTLVQKAIIAGWTGYSVINIPSGGITTYGGSASHYQYIRFTFGYDGLSANPTAFRGLDILGLKAFGGFGWKTPSVMAQTGHVYKADFVQNATFPAKVTASQFVGKLGASLALGYTAANRQVTLKDGNTSYGVATLPEASASSAGLMTAADKSKLDNLKLGVSKTTMAASVQLKNDVTTIGQASIGPATSTYAGVMTTTMYKKLNTLALGMTRDSSSVKVSLNANNAALNTISIPTVSNLYPGLMTPADKAVLDNINETGSNEYDISTQLNALLRDGPGGALTQLNIGITLEQLAAYPWVAATIDSEYNLSNGGRLSPGHYRFRLYGAAGNYTGVTEAYLIGMGYYTGGGLNNISAFNFAVRVAYGSYGHGTAEWGINGYATF